MINRVERAEEAKKNLSERVTEAPKNRIKADFEIFLEPRGRLEYCVYHNDSVLVSWTKRPLKDAAKVFARRGELNSCSISLAHGDGPITVLTTIGQALEMDM